MMNLMKQFTSGAMGGNMGALGEMAKKFGL